MPQPCMQLQKLTVVVHQSSLLELGLFKVVQTLPSLWLTLIVHIHLCISCSHNIHSMEDITWFFLAAASCCLTMTAAQTNTNLTTDESALLALKARITSDPRNMIFTNWSATTNVCNWVGVTCGARHHRVAVLNLSYMGLTGTLPPQLGNLSFLVQLSFTNNSFYGTLPPELGWLRRLKSISITSNNFMGIIPSWLGSLSKLQGLYLHGNRFSGFIPAAIFNLSALQQLDLSYNQLSGSIPAAIFSLSALQIMDVSHNQLSGSIPREIGNLTNLKGMNLDGNHFKEIPKEVGALHQLEKLSVQENALQGPIPTALFNMSSLSVWTFYRNNLTGSLPDNICQHLPSIQALDLNNNYLNGPLPSKLWQCKQLIQMQLAQNSFSGSIPTSIGNLTQIKTIRLDYNNLKGTIPPEIGDLPNLEKLSIGINNLNGLIPSSVFNMSTITSISFSTNQLSGNLPVNIGLGLPNLQKLYLGDNKLSGVVATSISNASQLMFLDLGPNLFHGFIPSTLCALTNLRRLSIYQNNFTIDTSTPKVNILTCLASLRNLRYIGFSSNPLNTQLPASFSNLSTSLQQIYLYDCNMRGNIPHDIGNLSSLIGLDWGSNHLSGFIPTSMGRLGLLQSVSFNDNNLQGHIPDELCQLYNLAMLSLVQNQLSGSIPSCLGNLALRKISLASNLLNSTIPATLWGLADMLELNLSSNFLVGPISEEVGNMKVVIVIDLSNNQFSGNIPSSIGGLQNLVNLSLANNKLEGSIPSSLANLPTLEFLDLSKNQLSGVIPKSLEELSYLKYLNLSFNILQGEIPIGGPFKNFSAQSFVSNQGLCGESQFQVPACKWKAGKKMLKFVVPGILSAMLLVTFIGIFILKRKKNVKSATETTFLTQPQWRRVSYQELMSATNGFTESSLLGTGGFGSVYKGTLPDGTDVAIKIFNLDLEGAFKSFEVECEMLANLRHRNLVKVISCCSQMDFKAVVLNYMPNGSLEKCLYSQNSCLDLQQRLNIMIDVASALAYLHHGYETPIVHCDLKPSNVLLDDDMAAHVADFGIAKLLSGGDSMTRTMTLATVGYMAPEYGMEGLVTKTGDVYSFGIVVMETFTRRKPTDEMFVGETSLKQWVANSLFLDAIVEVVDATLLGKEEDHEFVRKKCLSSIMRLALSCSAELSEERVTMHEALATLKKIKVKFF